MRVLDAASTSGNPDSHPLQFLAVRAGAIQAIGRMENAPEDQKSKRIDGQGSFVSPGFVDAHGHLLRSQAGWDEKSIRRSYIDYLRFGVLYVRSMRGERDDPKLRAKIDGGLWLGPHLILGSPPISGRNLEKIGDPADWLEEQKLQGFDFVKCLSGLDGPELSKWTQASRNANLPWFGHAPASGLSGALQGKVDGIEHISPFVRAFTDDEERFSQSLIHLGKNNVCHSASLLFYERYAQRTPTEELERKPGMEFVPDGIRGEWVSRLEELAPRKEGYAKMVDQYLGFQKDLVAAGIPILISPSAGPFILPGYGYQEEIALLERGGMSPHQIWLSATQTAFDHTPLSEGLGPVAIGAKANFVLLAGNPLENSRNMSQVLGVSIRGSWYSEKELRSEAEALLPAKQGVAPK